MTDKRQPVDQWWQRAQEKRLSTWVRGGVPVEPRVEEKPAQRKRAA